MLRENITDLLAFQAVWRREGGYSYFVAVSTVVEWALPSCTVSLS